MRPTIFAAALIAAASALAQVPPVLEHELRDASSNPLPFNRTIGLFQNGYFATSLRPAATKVELFAANLPMYPPYSWTISGGASLPLGSELLAHSKNAEGGNLVFRVPGTPAELRTYYVFFSGSVSEDEAIPLTPGTLRNAIAVPDQFGNMGLCWLMSNPSGDYVRTYRRYDWMGVGAHKTIQIERSKHLQNYFIDKVRTGYLTTVAYDGSIHHRQLYTNAFVRWHKTFPSETRVLVDTDGFTYAFRSTTAGVTISRFDFNGNETGSRLVPLSHGRRIDSAVFEPQRYLMMAVSRPVSSGRATTLLRISPTLDIRALPLDGTHNSDSPTELTADHAQTYACSITSTSPREELLQAVDTRFLISRWTDRRVTEVGEDRSKMMATSFGMITTRNRGVHGLSRKYLDSGLLGFWPETKYTTGNRSLGLNIYRYHPTSEDRIISFTSTDPVNCQVPATRTWPSSFQAWDVNVQLAPVTSRKTYRVDAVDQTTGEKRSVTIVVDP